MNTRNDMTNQEINNKIAELKGYIPGVSMQFDSVNGVSLNRNSMPEGKFDMFAESKNWAEKISDAVELFEEMPARYEISKVDIGDKYFWKCQHRHKQGVAIGDTAPLVICLAWIKWKESQ